MRKRENVIEQLKEKSKSKTKSVLMLIAICIVLGLMSLLSSAWFGKQSIKNIKISGNNVMTASEINAIIDAQIMNVENEGLDLVDIKNKLISNEFIVDADVCINSRGVLGIEITERVPIAIVLDANGNTMLTDQFGEIFSYKLYKEFGNLPIISNIFSSNKNKLNKMALSGAIEIISELESSCPQLGNITSEIKYISKDKTYLMYLTEADICINIGRVDKLSSKLNNIFTFWKEIVLLSSNKDKYTKLDARWENCIIVKTI